MVRPGTRERKISWGQSIETPKASRPRRQRRREGEVWGGVHIPHPTMGLGERPELPQRGPGGAPAQNEFGAF